MNRPPDSTLYKVPLILSSVLLSIGVFQAHLVPAHMYELSIYTATPLTFWVGVVSSIVTSIVFIILFKKEYQVGLFLCTLSIIAVFSLPLIRGYYFFGEGDALTHLGDAKALRAGLFDPLNSFYPSGHILSIIIDKTLNIPIERAMLFPGLISILMFVIGVTLMIRRLYERRFTTVIAGFSALLLLVVGRNGVHFVPNMIGRLYLICPLLLAILSISNQDWRHYILFIISSVGLLFFHAQIMLSLVLILTGISLAYLIKNLQLREITIHRHTSFSATIVSGIILCTWIITKKKFANAASGLIISLIAPSPGADSTSSVSSLRQVGGSVVEIFLKLFAPHTLFVSITSTVCISTLYLFFIKSQDRNLDEFGDEDKLAILLTFGLLLIFLLFVVTFVASVHYMRYFYTAMVLVTLLGVIGVKRLDIPSRDFSTRLITSVTLIILVISILLVAFPSPYIYLHNSQVTESQMHGYKTTFENREESIDFVKVRSPPQRYFDATRGFAMGNDQEITAVKTPDHFADHQLVQYYDEKQYLPVTQADRTRDPTVYGGFRYNRSDFRYLDNQEDINKVQSNNQYDLYLID